MWFSRKKEPSLEEQVKKLLKVHPKAGLYAGDKAVPGTKYLSVSPDFKPDVALPAIQRVWRKLT